MNEAARWLKQMREREGVSLRQLAAAVGSSHQTISDAETKGSATTDTWIKLAEHYQESLLRVLYWAKKLKKPPSDDDVVAELQDRLTVKMLDSFPKNERESVLKRLALEVEDIHEKRKRNGKP